MSASVFVFFCFYVNIIFSCTNLIVTPGASTTGSTLIAYTADSHVLYGGLRNFPPTYNETEFDVFEWDTGVYLGTIPQISETFNVLSNMNDHQVVITETTFGGLSKFWEPHPDDILDYGNIIWLALQRSTSARNAIDHINELIQEYGYRSEGESFSIGDPNEAWIMEVMPKGSMEKGAVWVACKIPNGEISAHANQARIQTFPLHDPENALYSDDLFDFARSNDLFPEDEPEEHFSFSDIFNPITFEGARFCESRVFSFFRKAQKGFADRYLNYAKGIAISNRMPLSIQPDELLSLEMIKSSLRDHFEGIDSLDMSIDVGAGPFNLPYRFRPLTFKVNGKEYLNERAIATQQTGFTVIANPTITNPDYFGILWFGVDDSAGTCMFPMFVGNEEVPFEWSLQSGSISNFTDFSAFWLFNQMNHFSYLRYSVVHEDILDKVNEVDSYIEKELTSVLRQGVILEGSGNRKTAKKEFQKFSKQMADYVYSEFKNLYGTLFTKYFDGDTRIPTENPMPDVDFPGYSQEFYDLIVEKTGEKLLVMDDPNKWSEPLSFREKMFVYMIITLFLSLTILFYLHVRYRITVR